MTFLRFLESIRTPALTTFFSLITYFGDELFFMALAITVFWCISKRVGYYILIVGFIGTVLNQFLKLWFRVPRPWVLDPGFSVVESARAGAGGYSFPSGHTQNIVGTMTCVLFTARQKWIRITAIALILLVPFSRMYLGCHTPLDVTVAFVTALILAVAFRSMAQKNDINSQFMLRILLCSALLSILFWAFVTFYRFPANVDAGNLAEGTKNAYTLFGCLTGLIAARTLDERYIHFQVKAIWWAQILKVMLGFLLLMAIRIGMKVILQSFLPELPANAVRYFLMVLFAGSIWPLTFPWFAKLGNAAHRNI